MNRLGLVLSLLTASLIGCTNSTYTPIGEADRFDEIDPADVPVLAESYGVIVDSEVNICKVDESPCSEENSVTAIARTRGIMAVDQNGGVVHGSLAACSIDLEWNGEDFDVPKYLEIESLGEIYTFDGGFTAGPDGPILNSDMSALVVGAQLDSPVSEDFPTDEDDARVFDQDGDGKTGVTANAPLGRKVFLGARAILDFTATVQADGSLKGPLSGHGFDVSVFDDNIPLVNVRKKMEKALGPLVLVSQSHEIIMHASVVDCAGLLDAEVAADTDSEE